MTIWSAFQADDGAVVALVEVERNGDEVGVEEMVLRPGDDGYEEALAVLETQEGDS